MAESLAVGFLPVSMTGLMGSGLEPATSEPLLPSPGTAESREVTRRGGAANRPVALPLMWKPVAACRWTTLHRLPDFVPWAPVR